MKTNDIAALSENGVNEQRNLIPRGQSIPATDAWLPVAISRGETSIHGNNPFMVISSMKTSDIAALSENGVEDQRNLFPLGQSIPATDAGLPVTISRGETIHSTAISPMETPSMETSDIRALDERGTYILL